jgi:hypothetical protein
MLISVSVVIVDVLAGREWSLSAFDAALYTVLSVKHP